MRKATGRLIDYARDAMSEPLILTESGKPIAALVPIQAGDFESLSLSTNPDFLDLIERSRRRQREEDGIPLEEVSRRLGLTDEEISEATASVDSYESGARRNRAATKRPRS